MASTPISRLRKALLQTDDSADGIQKSADAMMQMYSSAPAAAAGEWKSCLSVCLLRQLLPLLYVANEVLQTSKRKHGTRFLESFSPLLPYAIRHVCERDKSIIEKVRRTVKIWGDRRVFSRRFVNEILAAVEDLRLSEIFYKPLPLQSVPKKRDSPESPAHVSYKSDDDSHSDFADIKPEAALNVEIPLAVSPRPREPSKVNGKTNKFPVTKNKNEEDDLPDTLLRPNKRRNSHRGSIVSKSTPSLNDMLTKLVELDNQFKKSLAEIDSLPEMFYSEDNDAMQDVVGEELVKMNLDLTKGLKLIKNQKKKIHQTTKEIYKLEQEIPIFVSPMISCIRQDDEQIVFCDTLSEKLNLIAKVHAIAKDSRDATREQESRNLAIEQAKVKHRQKELARQKSLEEAMKQQTGPDMSWNSRTKQYESVADHTDDAWR